MTRLVKVLVDGRVLVVAFSSVLQDALCRSVRGGVEKDCGSCALVGTCRDLARFGGVEREGVDGRGVALFCPSCGVCGPQKLFRMPGGGFQTVCAYCAYRARRSHADEELAVMAVAGMVMRKCNGSAVAFAAERMLSQRDREAPPYRFWLRVMKQIEAIRAAA